MISKEDKETGTFQNIETNIITETQGVFEIGIQ